MPRSQNVALTRSPSGQLSTHAIAKSKTTAATVSAWKAATTSSKPMNLTTER